MKNVLLMIVLALAVAAAPPSLTCEERAQALGAVTYAWATCNGQMSQAQSAAWLGDPYAWEESCASTYGPIWDGIESLPCVQALPAPEHGDVAADLPRP